MQIVLRIALRLRWKRTVSPRFSDEVGGSIHLAQFAFQSRRLISVATKRPELWHGQYPADPSNLGRSERTRCWPAAAVHFKRRGPWADPKSAARSSMDRRPGELESGELSVALKRLNRVRCHTLDMALNGRLFQRFCTLQSLAACGIMAAIGPVCKSYPVVRARLRADGREICSSAIALPGRRA